MSNFFEDLQSYKDVTKPEYTLESNTDLLEMKLIKIQKPESKSRKG